MHLLGLDVGTTGCKAVVFDPEGAIKGYGFAEYGFVSDEPNKAEQDALEVWNITKAVIRRAVDASGVKDIAALSLSVQGDAIIPVDRALVPLYPAVLGMDYRSEREAAQVAEKIGDRRLFETTGMRSHPMNSFVKLLWLKARHPDVVGKAWKIMTYADFILGRLGAEPVIDYTMASRTMAFELEGKRWSPEILATAGVDAGLFSRPVASGTPVGTIDPAVARETGLSANVVLVSGGHDQPCAALGAGVTGEGLGVVSTGTAEVFSTAFSRPATGDAMYGSFYPCTLYTIEGLYFTFSLNHVGGLLLRWYRDTFRPPEVAEAEAQGRDPYDVMLEKVPAEPARVMVLPHLIGSGTPWCDISSKGAIVGLRMDTGRHEIVRALLESQSCELAINVERMEQAGIRVDEVRAVGGGAKSPLWLQLKADILRRPVCTLAVREAACLGAAVLAGAATGVYDSAHEGVARTVKVKDVYEPDDGLAPFYRDRLDLYRELYPSLRSINGRL